MKAQATTLERGTVTRPDDLLVTAAAVMVAQDVLSLEVGTGAERVGILTSADIVRAVADGVDLMQTTVERYMTSDLPPVP